MGGGEIIKKSLSLEACFIKAQVDFEYMALLVFSILSNIYKYIIYK